MRCALVVLVALLAAPAHAQQSVPEIPFDSVPNFFQYPPEMNLGEMAAVAVNSKGHIFMLSRSNISGPAFGALANQVLEFDADGKFVREIGKGLYAWSFGHGIRVDKDDNIWVADKGSDMIIKFNPEGHVVMVFGRKQEASDEGGPYTREFRQKIPPPEDGRFRQPTDMAWDAQGNTFIADGYVNSRVAKFDKNGVPIKSWGERGAGPGQFNTVHNIGVDARGNVYVADRGNRRIQVFDGDGGFLRIITIDIPAPPGSRAPIGNTPALGETSGLNVPGQPWVICITPGTPQYLYTADAYPGRIYKLTLEGKVVGMLGKAGKQPKEFGWIHGMACPSENELYVADLLNWRVQKLLLHPGQARTSTVSNR